jgi:ferritin
MLSDSVQGAINKQINHEFASAYVYLSMSAYFERTNFEGFASWARVQSQEEIVHAMKLFDYLNDRGGVVRLHAVPEPPNEFASPLSVFERALDQEKQVTKLIHELYEFAADERDHPTQVALEWFIQEQVEEEKSISVIVEQLRMVGDNGTGLLLLDRELGARKPAQSEPASA